jgi:dethiobiotin synthetase
VVETGSRVCENTHRDERCVVVEGAGGVDCEIAQARGFVTKI